MITIPYIGQKVSLSESKMVQVREFTHQVCLNWIKRGIKQKNYASLEEMVEHRIHGFAAKHAYAQLVNEKYDPPVGKGGRYSGNGDPVWDLMVEGWHIKVGSTKYPDGKLIGHPHLKDLPPDFHVLMVGENGEFAFMGYMKDADLFDDKRYVKYFKGTGGPAYLASQDELIAALP